MKNAKFHTAPTATDSFQAIRNAPGPATTASTPFEKSLVSMMTEMTKRLEGLDLRIASMELQRSETDRLAMRQIKNIDERIVRMAHVVDDYNKKIHCATKDMSHYKQFVISNSEFTTGQLTRLHSHCEETVKLLSELNDSVASTGTNVANIGIQLAVALAQKRDGTLDSGDIKTKLEYIQAKTENPNLKVTSTSVQESHDSGGTATTSDAQPDSLMTTFDSLEQKFNGMKAKCERQSSRIDDFQKRYTKTSEAMREISERIARLNTGCDDLIVERYNSKFVPSPSRIVVPRQEDSQEVVQRPLKQIDASPSSFQTEKRNEMDKDLPNQVEALNNAGSTTRAPSSGSTKNVTCSDEGTDLGVALSEDNLPDKGDWAYDYIWTVW